jgi:hypothetical protein
VEVWTIVTNTGTRAILTYGSQRKEVKRPKCLTMTQFVDLLRPGTQILESAISLLSEW